MIKRDRGEEREGEEIELKPFEWVSERASEAWLNNPIPRPFFLDNGQRPYEDWYRSARLALLDHQTDWYYTPSPDEDKVSVIILNRRACQGRKIRPCRWLQERSADCHADLSRPGRRRWKNSVRLRTELRARGAAVIPRQFVMVNIYARNTYPVIWRKKTEILLARRFIMQHEAFVNPHTHIHSAQLNS